MACFGKFVRHWSSMDSHLPVIQKHPVIMPHAVASTASHCTIVMSSVTHAVPSHLHVGAIPHWTGSTTVVQSVICASMHAVPSHVHVGDISHVAWPAAVRTAQLSCGVGVSGAGVIGGRVAPGGRAVGGCVAGASVAGGNVSGAGVSGAVVAGTSVGAMVSGAGVRGAVVGGAGVGAIVSGTGVGGEGVSGVGVGVRRQCADPVVCVPYHGIWHWHSQSPTLFGSVFGSTHSWFIPHEAWFTITRHSSSTVWVEYGREGLPPTYHTSRCLQCQGRPQKAGHNHTASPRSSGGCGPGRGRSALRRCTRSPSLHLHCEGTRRTSRTAACTHPTLCTTW